MPLKVGDKVFIQGMPVMPLEVIDVSDPALLSCGRQMARR